MTALSVMVPSLLFAVMAGALTFVGASAFAVASRAYQRQFKTSATRNLADLFLFIEPDKLFQVNLALIAGVFLLVFVLVRSAVVAVMMAAVIGASPQVLFRVLKERRRAQVVAQLPDTLMAVATSMRAGLSLGQALETVVTFEKGPLIQELSLLQRETRVGTDFGQALDNWYERVPKPEIQLVCAAMKISRETGGNLAETLERIASTLRQKLQMEGKINSLTAQGKLQGIVMTALPVFLGLVLYRMEPEAMGLMFSEWYGWLTIAAILVLETVGFFFIRKIVNIDV